VKIREKVGEISSLYVEALPTKLGHPHPTVIHCTTAEHGGLIKREKESSSVFGRPNT